MKTTIIKNVATFMSTHASAILSGVAIAGVGGTAFLAAKGALKADDILSKKAEQYNAGLTDQLPTKKEAVKAVWKCYIPAAAFGVTTCACILGAHKVNAKRIAAMAAAYSVAEKQLKDYKGKVKELFGEKEAEKVKDALAKDAIENDPPDIPNMIPGVPGQVLFYDKGFSGRYFYSTIDKICKAQNKVNQMVLNENGQTLNDFYWEIGAPELGPIDVGNRMGWDPDAMLEVEFSTQLCEQLGLPCIVIDYDVGQFRHW